MTLPQDPTVSLCLHLFGPFAVQVNGTPLPRLRSRKVQLLLALLTLRAGTEVARPWLAGLLWPDSPERTALATLRGDLTSLRHALGAAAARLCSPTPRTLLLELAEEEADLLTFDAAVARGDPVSLAQAVAAYRGPLLEGWTEEWVFQERQSREQAYLGALETLAGWACEQGDALTAERYLRRAMAVDPLRESVQRALMQALAAGGNYAAALLAYRELRLLLHKELNAEADPETQALFERLRAEARRRARVPPGRGGPGRAGRRPQTLEGEPTPLPLAGADLERQERPAAVHWREPGIRGPLESWAQDDFSLIHAGTPAGASGLPLIHAPDHNLPVQLTRFIGREREMAEVRRLQATTHLLTLTGAGGCGKTRLALQVAASVLEEFPEGVWLVDLAPLVDPALVPQAVATVLGVREQAGRPVAETLLDRLRPRFLLLILDNCEHLLTAVAQLAERLLRACPHLRILATSREGLNIVGEQMSRVPPLSLPPVEGVGCRVWGVGSDADRPVFDSAGPYTPHPTPYTLMKSEAVQLFVDRASANQPSFAVTAGNAPAVAQICRCLDGIPLAIELAAARVKALPVEQIVQRLDDRFRLLTGGSRTALPRQQTLRAAMDWSYELLAEPERTLLRRLSVFAGGFTLAVAEAICSGEAVGCQPSAVGEDRPVLADGRSALPAGGTRTADSPLDVFDRLTMLVEKSLVVYEEQGAEARYRLLETVRQYAHGRLLESGEAAVVRGRHLEFFLRLAEEVEAKLWGPDQAAWFDRLEKEHDNFRVALERCKAEPQGASAGLRLAGALRRLWSMRGYCTEGRQWLAELLASPGASAHKAERATALYAAAILASKQGDYAAARSFHEESLALRRELSDKEGIVLSLVYLGQVLLAQGDCEAARAIYEESLAVGHHLGDRSRIAFSLHHLGDIAFHTGDYERARSLYAESLALRRELGDKHYAAFSLDGLGDVARCQSNYRLAEDLYRESLALRQELADKHCTAVSLSGLAELAFDQRDYRQAGSLYTESLILRREHGEKRGVIICLEGLAGVFGVHGQPDKVARLLGATTALRALLGSPRSPQEHAQHARKEAAARTVLGEELFAAAWTEGQGMTLDQAVDCALEGSADA